MFYKNFFIVIITLSLLFSCNAPINNNVSSLNDTYSGLIQYRIKSTQYPEEIKKIFFKERFTRNKAKPKTEIRTFNINVNDLNRRFILNIFNGSENTERVSSATIKINDKIYTKQNEFNQNISDISFKIDNLVLGLNRLEIELESKPDSSIYISIDGFLEPLNIADAIHSRIPDDLVGSNDYVKGKINIKFLEGTKIRLLGNSNNKKLKDLNGTSISSLEEILRDKVKDIYKSIDLPYEELDEEELLSENFLNKEIPNMGLFYTIELIDKEKNVWDLITKIKDLPYIEEAYPNFTNYTANFSYKDNKYNVKSVGLPVDTFPNDSITNLIIGNYNGNKWLKVTHVMKNNEDNGLWSLTKGDKDIVAAIIDTGGFEHINSNCIDEQSNNNNFVTTSNSNSFHEDLKTNCYEYVDNTDKNAISQFFQENPLYREKMQHGVNSSSILGSSLTNNSIGTSGIAINNKIINIKAHIGKYKIDINNDILNNDTVEDSVCACKGTTNVTSKCQSIPDSIIIARRKNARIIVLENAQDTKTIEQYNPIVRTLIAGSVSKGIVMIVPAGNNGNTDISKIIVDGREYPMVDTGSIIVGGLKIDGSSRFYIKNDPKAFNYGKSQMGGIYNLFTVGGHGVDICAPAEHVSTMSLYDLSSIYTGFPPGLYDYNFGGTSAGAPIIGGITALLLSEKPQANPLEIRRALRKSENRNFLLPDSQDTAGMVNAYRAYYELNTSSIPPNENLSYKKEGLIAKIYPNTIYLRPETIVANQHHQPFAIKIYPNDEPGYNVINFTGLNSLIGTDINYLYSTWNDPFRTWDSSLQLAVKDFFVADFKGELKVDQEGYYSFIIGHDDGVILEIDDNVIIDANYPTPFRYDYSNNIYLEKGYHRIRLMFSEITREAALNLFWKKPNGTVEYIPKNNLYHNKSEEEPNYQYQLKPQIVGRFFDFSNREIINPPFQNNTTQQLTIYPQYSNLYNTINFNKEEDFSIPYRDNFVGFFSGFIKLPSNYKSGNYQIIVGHDDGIQFYFNGEKLIDKLEPTAYVEDSAIVNLKNNIYYPFVLTYDERLGGALLKLFWKKPNGQNEIIPNNALFH